MNKNNCPHLDSLLFYRNVLWKTGASARTPETTPTRASNRFPRRKISNFVASTTIQQVPSIYKSKTTLIVTFAGFYRSLQFKKRSVRVGKYLRNFNHKKETLLQKSHQKIPEM